MINIVKGVFIIKFIIAFGAALSVFSCSLSDEKKMDRVLETEKDSLLNDFLWKNSQYFKSIERIEFKLERNKKTPFKFTFKWLEEISYEDTIADLNLEMYAQNSDIYRAFASFPPIILFYDNKKNKFYIDDLNQVSTSINTLYQDKKLEKYPNLKMLLEGYETNKNITTIRWTGLETYLNERKLTKDECLLLMKRLATLRQRLEGLYLDYKIPIFYTADELMRFLEANSKHLTKYISEETGRGYFRFFMTTLKEWIYISNNIYPLENKATKEDDLIFFFIDDVYNLHFFHLQKRANRDFGYDNYFVEEQFMALPSKYEYVMRSVLGVGLKDTIY